MSDTPKTNAAIKAQAEWRRPFVSYTMDGVTWDGPVADLCRRMERERDEARDMAENLTEHGLDLMDANRLLKAKIKRQAERIRKLEGATNHAGGLYK